jgi:ABC-type enterobactin transport system permease subunit
MFDESLGMNTAKLEHNIQASVEGGGFINSINWTEVFAIVASVGVVVALIANSLKIVEFFRRRSNG